MLPMRKVELQTRDRKFVAIVEIVPFPDRGMPDIVAWGERVFIRGDYNSEGIHVTMPADQPWPYVEAFAHVSFTPSPGLPKE